MAQVNFYQHGGIGGPSHFDSLKEAAEWIRGRGYTVEWKKGNAEFLYFDSEGTEIGGYFR